MPTNRTDKLNSEFRKEIYTLLTTKVKDPRMTEMFTITEVVCDRELAVAKVFVSVLSTDEHRATLTMEAIVNAAGFVRQQISRTMHIRTVPRFIFMVDNSMAYSQKINDILSGLKNNDEQ